MTKRKRPKPDAVPTIFHRPALNVAATSHVHLQEGPSAVGHKRAALAEESIPLKKKKAAFEKQERELGYVATVATVAAMAIII